MDQEARMPVRRPPLSIEQILAWADAHHARTGVWPTAHSGPAADAPVETWGAINNALTRGHRGLPRGDSLARLLDRHREHRQDNRVSWTAAEDEWVRTLPPAAAAAQTGHSLRAVYQRRYRLGVGLPPDQRGWAENAPLVLSPSSGCSLGEPTSILVTHRSPRWTYSLQTTQPSGSTL
jgi:hypothetical protein